MRKNSGIEIDPVDWQTNQVNISRYVLTQWGQADTYAYINTGFTQCLTWGFSAPHEMS